MRNEDEVESHHIGQSCWKICGTSDKTSYPDSFLIFRYVAQYGDRISSAEGKPLPASNTYRRVSDSEDNSFFFWFLEIRIPEVQEGVADAVNNIVKHFYKPEKEVNHGNRPQCFASVLVCFL